MQCKRHKWRLASRGGLSRSGQMESSHSHIWVLLTPVPYANRSLGFHGWFVTSSISVRRNPQKLWYGVSIMATGHGTGGLVHRTYAGGTVCRGPAGRTDGWDQLGAGEAIHQPSGREKKIQKKKQASIHQGNEFSLHLI